MEEEKSFKINAVMSVGGCSLLSSVAFGLWQGLLAGIFMFFALASVAITGFTVATAMIGVVLNIMEEDK